LIANVDTISKVLTLSATLSAAVSQKHVETSGDSRRFAARHLANDGMKGDKYVDTSAAPRIESSPHTFFVGGATAQSSVGKGCFCGKSEQSATDAMPEDVENSHYAARSVQQIISSSGDTLQAMF